LLLLVCAVAVLILSHPVFIFMPIASKQSQLAFHNTQRALTKLFSAQDAESVHGFRTATLRLQTLLQELLPERDRKQKKLLRMLEGLRKRAGKVRDLDVQLDALRSLKVPQEPRRKTQLIHGLIELRVKHENKLRKLLNKKNVREIEERLKRASKQVKAEGGRDPLTVARAMLARILRPAGPMKEDLLHRYRIAIKRARYAAEFAPKSAEAGQFLAQLKTLQDAAGNWHDWLILTKAASKKIGDADHSPLVAALLRVTGSKFRHAVAALSASPAVQAGTKTVAKPLAMPASPSQKLRTKASTLGARAKPAA
jgi:CHAD domain-containing protein